MRPKHRQFAPLSTLDACPQPSTLIRNMPNIFWRHDFHNFKLPHSQLQDYVPRLVRLHASACLGTLHSGSDFFFLRARLIIPLSHDRLAPSPVRDSCDRLHCPGSPRGRDHRWLLQWPQVLVHFIDRSNSRAASYPVRKKRCHTQQAPRKIMRTCVVA